MGISAQSLYLLTGPTASGKTALALDWAEKQGAAILSCDAFQVYKGMDIGSAKPSTEDQARVPHYGLDIFPVSQPASVAAYAAYAKDRLHALWKRHQPVLICGGSGFYLKSFLAPVVDAIAVSPEIREQVRRLHAEEGLSAMVEMLNALNPEGLGGLDAQNPRRVERALERCMASGCSLNQMQAAFAAQPAPYPDRPRKVAILEVADGTLRERIERRTQGMIEDGLIEEVRALKKSGLLENPSAARAIGYRETLAMLEAGTIDHKELAQQISRNTWHLVRKQRSWLRNQLSDTVEVRNASQLETAFSRAS